MISQPPAGRDGRNVMVVATDAAAVAHAVGGHHSGALIAVISRYFR